MFHYQPGNTQLQPPFWINFQRPIPNQQPLVSIEAQWDRILQNQVNRLLQRTNGKILTFAHWADSTLREVAIQRIGKGVTSSALRVRGDQDTVYKVMRVNLPELFRKPCNSSTIGEIVDEIVALEALKSCPGQVAFYGLTLVQGAPPPPLPKNAPWATPSSPVNRATFPKNRVETRLFAVLAMSYGGETFYTWQTNLSPPRELSDKEGWFGHVSKLATVLLGLLALLANAEQELEYEVSDPIAGRAPVRY